MPRVPLTVKLAYTLWMLVWVPAYWVENGPANFLWICDFANFMLLAALWLESPLLATSQFAGVLIIQLGWAADFSSAILFGSHAIGGTEYMFDETRPSWLRALSLFHLWTVPLLAWLGRRVGFDRRGWRLAAAVALVLFPLGQWVGTREQNLNWMWRPFGVEQRGLPPVVFPFVAVGIATLLLFLPGSGLARRIALGGRNRQPPDSGVA